MTALSYSAFSSNWTVSVVTPPESGHYCKERERETETDMETEIDRQTDSDTERQLVPSRLSPTPLSPPAGQSALLLWSQVCVTMRERDRNGDRDR